MRSKKFYIAVSALLILACVSSGYSQNTQETKKQNDRPLTIKSKVRAEYPRSGKSSACNSVVALNVEFLADKKIGKIEYLSAAIPDELLAKCGLIPAAIEAAKKIKFLSMIKDGEAVTVVKRVEYTFDLY